MRDTASMAQDQLAISLAVRSVDLDLEQADSEPSGIAIAMNDLQDPTVTGPDPARRDADLAPVTHAHLASAASGGMTHGFGYLIDKAADSRQLGTIDPE
jgi:hypothetical protein